VIPKICPQNLPVAKSRRRCGGEAQSFYKSLSYDPGKDFAPMVVLGIITETLLQASYPQRSSL
jgi:hypothetical protein